MSKRFMLVLLPLVSFLFSVDTQSQSPGATITSHYELNRNANAGTNSDNIDDPVEREAFRTLTTTSDAIERLKLTELFLAAYPRS